MTIQGHVENILKCAGELAGADSTNTAKMLSAFIAAATDCAAAIVALEAAWHNVELSSETQSYHLYVIDPADVAVFDRLLTRKAVGSDA